MSQIIYSSGTRKSIRQSVGINSGHMLTGTATANGTATTLIDTYTLSPFALDEIKGRQIQINSAATTAAAVGEKAFINSFNPITCQATLYSTLTNAIKSTQEYEMWDKGITIEKVNNLINDCIISVTDEALQEKTDTTIATEYDKYEYPIPTGFVGIYSVERVSKIAMGETLSDCDSEWTGGTNATVSLDTEIMRTGSACNKIVVASGATTNEIIAHKTITSADCSNYDTIEFWFRSSVALSAADYAFCLDNTAACASPLETISLPAITANTWTKVQLTMANPVSDTGIVSIGLKQVVDKNALTICIDEVKILKAASRVFTEIPTNYWSVNKDDFTFKLTSEGLSSCGADAVLRLSGYSKPATLTDDTTASVIDPDFLVSMATARLLSADKDKVSQVSFYLAQAEKRKANLRTPVNPNTRMVI